MPLSKRLRYEVFRRDDFACRYCGAKAPDAQLTVDHVVPIALGGSDEPGNLVTACADCNAGKTSSSPDAPIVENVADDALRWAAAMEEAARIQRGELDRYEKVYRAFDEEIWARWGLAGNLDEPIPLPADWKQSIAQFIDSGLTEKDLTELVDTAMEARNVWAANKWRYFCGCAWRRINERQEIAKSLIETDKPEAEPSE